MCNYVGHSFENYLRYLIGKVKCVQYAKSISKQHRKKKVATLAIHIKNKLVK